MSKIYKELKESLHAYNRHEKTWGYELWIANHDEYCGKLLYIKKLKSTSMHFHVDKLETMYVARGTLVLDLIDPETGEEYVELLECGDSIDIPCGQPHRLRASVDDCTVYEFSTHHEDADSYRVGPRCG